MKIFLVCAVLLISNVHAKDIEEETSPVKTSFVVDNNELTDETRIAGGTEARPMENLDFVRLTIVFQNQLQTCGGSLINNNWVLTAATCVVDPVEGLAAVVNITLPQVRTANGTNSQRRIVVHPMFNNETFENNLALIRLTNATGDPDNRSFGFANLNFFPDPNSYVNTTLRVCGFGSIANFLTVPATLRCANLWGASQTLCGLAMPNPNLLCTKWDAFDFNLCNGDYGGGLYRFTYHESEFLQILIGIASHSTDRRPNASCSGGHAANHTNIVPYENWINQVAFGIAPPAPAMMMPGF